MSRPIAIRRQAIHRDLASSPVYEFYEREAFEEDMSESEDEGEDNQQEEEEDDSEDEDDEDDDMDLGEEGEGSRRISLKKKGKGRVSVNEVQVRPTRDRSDLNSKTPIIVLRTGEGWDWSRDALTTAFVREEYSRSFSSSPASFTSRMNPIQSSSASESTPPDDAIVQSVDIFVGQDEWL